MLGGGSVPSRVKFGGCSYTVLSALLSPQTEGRYGAGTPIVPGCCLVLRVESCRKRVLNPLRYRREMLSSLERIFGSAPRRAVALCCFHGYRALTVNTARLLWHHVSGLEGNPHSS